MHFLWYTACKNFNMLQPTFIMSLLRRGSVLALQIYEYYLWYKVENQGKRKCVFEKKIQQNSTKHNYLLAANKYYHEEM